MARTAASTKRTPERKAIFLEILAWCGVVTYAANSAGISRSTAYDWRREDEEFATEWDAALEQACDIMEMEARRRGVDGVSEPVFYRGKKCGSVQKYSDTLLMFMLNGNRPQKFKRRAEITGKDGGPIEVEQTIKIGDKVIKF